MGWWEYGGGTFGLLSMLIADNASWKSKKPLRFVSSWRKTSLMATSPIAPKPNDLAAIIKSLIMAKHVWEQTLFWI